MGKKDHAGYPYGYGLSNMLGIERLLHRLMEMKMVNQQSAEFKDIPKIKVKK